ncbi:lysylphosphatidylglycerol synthase transmembrane domain-containing protein [Terrabacter sp. MAHUQ-38]|uniref:lysylphosphatidylglycerol synthase transmembrane domain-containing protein n=1 Tax=unclassified Terrabacter TaxID=2630222 RepID=UPI00165E608B|nr:lysylphosphatidylglycerol synthase transmembrane domain-containing protein [Terrabacter sp. MAHUQ-38]MBC9823426.1 flippase-like domain-containing protein [Terrabacter sp. MAHUQ-38]
MPGKSERTRSPTGGPPTTHAAQPDDTTGETMRRTAEDVHESEEREVHDDLAEPSSEERETTRATGTRDTRTGETADPTDRADTSEGSGYGPASGVGGSLDVDIVEPPIPERVRRPVDGVRLAAAVLVLVVGLVVADLAADTRGAVEQDLTEATSGLPRLVLTLLGWMSGIGVLLLPIGVGADLLARRRPMQLIQALGAAVVAGILVIVLAVLVQSGNGGFVTDVLTRPTPTGRTGPLDIVIVSMVALLTVADISGRKWISPIATGVVIATLVTTLLSGAMTLAALACSLLVGWIVGLAFRLSFGVTSTRPPATEVAAVLVAGGIPLTRLELIDANDAGDRRYAGTTPEGPLDVHVVDRDTFGLASGRRLLRVLRLRSGFTRPPALTLRSEIEHRTLMGLALHDAGIGAPRPVAVSEVGPFSAVIAYVEPVGSPVADLGDRLDDAQLAGIWRLAATLHQRRIVHRHLSPSTVLVTDQGRVSLASLGSGDVAADDISLRIDLAQLLTTVALAVGPERTVDSAVAALGEDAVLRAVPVLQPVALSPDTRAALNQSKSVMGELRELLVALRPREEAVEPVQLRRISARGVVTIIGGGIAGYLLLTQLAQVDIGQVVSTADWRWAALLAAFAAATFAGASLALAGAVQIRLRFIRTYMTQLAVAFSGLVAPAAVGNIALNTRYLQKSGLPPTIAGASVGVAQVAQFCSYFVLLVISGVLAGTGPAVSFSPSPVLVAGILVVVILALGLLAVPGIRGLLFDRVLPQVRSAVPQVLAVLQHPKKLTQLLGGALLLDVSFVAALVCATKAFGAGASIAAIAVVYFAGAIVGSAVPTPGGLGGIEAAMSFGLISIGVDSGTAVSSVLLYRLATYWLPIPFGWFSLNRLQKVGAI